MTTPVPTRKLLKEYLDHLDEKTLKDFQWNLVQIEINGSRPIPIAKLPKNSTREATVDKLVEAFGEDGAVERTVETFREMNVNDLASKLIQAKADQSKEQKEDESETSCEREKLRNFLAFPKDPTFLTYPIGVQCGHSRSCDLEDAGRSIFHYMGAKHDFDDLCHASLFNLYEKCRGRIQGEPSGGHRNNTETFQTPPETSKEVKQWRHSSIELIKTQSNYKKKQIKDNFKRRRALLDEEEKTSLVALRKETEQKILWANFIADTTENTLQFYYTRRFRVDKIFREVFKVVMLCVLAVGVGWATATFSTAASGIPSTHCLRQDLKPQETTKVNNNDAQQPCP